MSLPAGTLLENRYRIEVSVSKGGMGAVYQGYDIKLAIKVAVKENFFKTPQHIKQFEKEARILARLHHPSLPRVIDHFCFEDKQYLVMDYIPGADLWALIEQQQSPLSEKQAIEYLIQVCDVVDYLHQQKPLIIHRDIKPQNIKITPAGQAVLVDFGIAQVDEADLTTGAAPQVITPGFSPPEQFSGKARTPASDIYALGATLYAIVTGQLAPDSIALRTGGATFVPPDLLNPNVSKQTARTIEHAMQPQRERRPQSVAAWQQELETVLALVPSLESNYGHGAPTVKSHTFSSADLVSPRQEVKQQAQGTAGGKTGHNGTPAWLWAALAASLILAIGMLTFQIGRSINRNSSTNNDLILIALAATVTAQYQAESAEPDLNIGATLMALAATATGQSQVTETKPLTIQVGVATSTPTPGPTVELTLLPAALTNTVTPQQTSLQTRASLTPTPTDKLRRIAFVSNRDRNDEIYLLQLGPDDSQQINLTQTSTENEQDPAWSPDGQWIIFTSSNIFESHTLANFTLKVMNAEGSNVQSVSTQSSAPTWSPDGLYLALTTLGDNQGDAFSRRIAVTGSDGSKGKIITPGNGRHPAWSPDGQRIVFDDNVDLYIINRDGSGLIRLTNPPADEREPVWSPDGQQIAFVSNGQGNDDIYIMNVDGSSVTRLTTDPADEREPAWSPDGQQIAFSTNRDGNWEIYVMRIDGREQVNLSRHWADDWQPAWAP